MLNLLCPDIPYILLYLTVISLWIPHVGKRPLWPFMLIISVISGLLCQQIRAEALIPIIALPAALFFQTRFTSVLIRFLAAILVIVLCVGLGAHLFPGFMNLAAIKHVALSPDAAPYSMTLNIDKTLIGIFIIGMCLPRIRTLQEWGKLLKESYLKILCIVIVLIAAALLLGFVRFEPKLSHYLPLWFITNLLFVCTAEEAFFRGFIQKNLTSLFDRFHYGNYLALVLASILFGLAHFAGGTKYMLLAGLAGLGYGWIYYRTKRIEASILAHISLNLTHFLLFTYPWLAHTLTR